MLTAQRQNTSLETESSQTTRSLDKMVTSIEGLRERVQGFTLEQVSEMDQRLRTMSLELRELQQRLTALSEMKQQMDGLQKVLQQAEAESLEQSRLAMLVEPIATQSLTQFGTLLKFRRVIKLLKDAKSGSGAIGPVTVTSRDAVFPKAVETTAAEPPKNLHELVADVPAIQHELTAESTNEDTAVLTDEAIEQSEAVFDQTPVEMEFESNEHFSNERGTITFFDDKTASIEPQEIIAQFADTREETPSSHEAIFEEFRGTGDSEVHLAIPKTEAAATTSQSPMAASEADFDQRFLEDLIKDYGEFTILPRSTTKVEVKKELEPTTVTPRAHKATTINLPTQPNLPSPRKDGDLDRKLKKLIKDYGEYDLYSRQTPLKLKTGVAAAFLVLTLIFSGFYFFSSSKSAVPTSTSSASQSQRTAETTSKETLSNGVTNSGETPSASVSNVDVAKPIEASTSQNVVNKATTKKTK